jgi:hypothetical protein
MAPGSGLSGDAPALGDLISNSRQASSINRADMTVSVSRNAANACEARGEAFQRTTGFPTNTSAPHHPVQGVLHHAAHAMGVFGARDEKGICNGDLGPQAQDRCWFVQLEVGIEQRQIAQAAMETQAQARRRAVGGHPQHRGIQRRLAQTAGQGQHGEGPHRAITMLACLLAAVVGPVMRGGTGTPAFDPRIHRLWL